MVLQSIRERLTGVMAFTILGILVIPFAFVGVNQYFTSSSGNLVAKVNDKEITYNDFNQSFSDYRRQMQSLMGASFDPEEFDKLTAKRQHLDNMIDQQLITQAALSMGLDVDDATLSEKIRSIPAFQIDGKFNPDVYQSRLTVQGLTPKQFERDVRSQVIISQLPQSIGQGSIATPEELKDFVALVNQSRTFGAVMVPAQVSAETADGGVTDQEIDDWYKAHPDAYQSEEQVIIQYIELDAADMPAGAPPTEDYLKQQFESQKARFVTPEQRKVAHILIAVAPDADEAVKETARQKAEDLAKRARGGEDFAELAKEYSQDKGSAAEGGDLGWIEPGVMVKTFEDAMYKLTMDHPISDPVQTSFGWHVIELEDVREASGMTFDEARPTLLREYEDEQASRAFLEQADRLVDLIYEDPTTLDSAAEQMGLKVQEAGPFGREGGAGIAANPEVVKTAFSDLVLLQGSVSDPVNLSEDSLVMIKLKKHLPAALKPLDEVRGQVVATLSQNRARDEAQQRAEELLKAAREGSEPLEKVAQDAGLEYARFEDVQRTSTEPDAQLVKEIFRLPRPAEGGSDKVVLPTGKGFAVVVLESVKDGVLDSGNPQVRQQYRRYLANASASEEVAALMQQLRAVADIQVFEENIK